LNKQGDHWEYRKASVLLKQFAKVMPSRQEWEGLRDGTVSPEVFAERFLSGMAGGRR